MTHELLDSDKQPKTKDLIKKIINSIVCIIYLASIAFCYGIFNTEPSLGYLVLLYVAFLMLILSIIQIRLHMGNNRIWAGIITIGSTVGLLLAALNNAPNESLMATGQLTTGISFVISLSLFILIWKK